MVGQADRPPGPAPAGDARPFTALVGQDDGEREDEDDAGAPPRPPGPPPPQNGSASLHVEAPTATAPTPTGPSPWWSFAWDNGAAAVSGATFSFSLAVLFVKLLGRRVPVLEITLARSGLSLLATLAVASLRGHSLRGSGTWGSAQLRPLLLLRGAIGCVAMVLYYAALVRLPMADAVLLFFVNVPATALAAWLFSGERMGGRALTGAALALAGLVLVLHPPWLFGGHEQWGRERALGVAAGLGSAALSAGAFLTIRAIGKREPALVVALYFHSATVMISAFPLLVLRFPEAPVWPASWSDALLMVGVAIGSFFGQLCLTRGFQLLPAGRASAINLTQVLFSTLWGFLAFGDVPTPLGFAGGALIVVGALLSGGGGGGAAGGASSASASLESSAGRAAGGEEDAEARVALTSVGGGAGGGAGGVIGGGGPERSLPSKIAKQQQQHPPPDAAAAAHWLAAREAAGAGVGSQLSLPKPAPSLLLPRSEREAAAMAAAAAATLDGDGEEEGEGGGVAAGRRRRSSGAAATGGLG